MKLLWICSLVMIGCGGGGGSGGPDGGTPGLDNNIACTMDTGSGHFCIGLENITKGQYDSEHDSCTQMHGVVTDKCASEMLAGCCQTKSGPIISLQCDYADLPSVTVQHDMSACSSPATWVTAVP